MCMILVLVLFVPLSAQSLLISLLGSGLDALDTHDGIAVNLAGERVFLGGSTLSSLKRTLKNHDFQQLPFEQRLELYEQVQVSITWPVFKNLLVGFGSGSKLQGDLGGQLFGQIADWTAATTIGVGLGTYLIDFLFIQIFTASSPNFDDPLQDFAVGTMVAGALFLVAERAIQALLPIPYGLRHNKALRTGLGITKEGSDALAFSVAAVPVLKNSRVGMQVAAFINF